MSELLKIQNDLLFTCLLISFIALMIAGFRISLQLYRGEDADYRILNWLAGVAVVLGFSYMLTSFVS